MEFLDYLSQVITIKMRIDLSRRDGFVTQHLLHGPQVSSTLYQVGGKRMPECMRTNAFLDPCLLGEVFDDRKYHHPGKFAAVAVEKNVRFKTFFW
jgi:hypothetical protein